ncbi:MAG: HAD-IA family hydrolase, partial [Clostridia bacterium]|nr:HAD-IA family hydrolase [Clostridia bacterium]
MKFTDFFWDFDGTLFDTYPRVNRAIQNALKDIGVTASIETIDPLAKVTVRHVFRVLCPHLEDAAWQRYTVHAEEEGYDSMRPYLGVRGMLSSVCAAGGRNYLYTHRDHTSLDALRHYGLDQYFTDSVTRESGFPSKPAPDALKYLLEKHGLDPARCVMLGDRDIDLDSGKNAGMACALFDPGHYYDHYDTPWRFTAMFEMMACFVWENSPSDLAVSDMLAMQDIQQERHPEWGGISPAMGRGKLLWMIGELGEVIDVIKKVPADALAAPGAPRARLTEELADVAMYFHDVLNCYGITAQEFSQAYYQKIRKNLQRDYTK